MGTTLWSRDRIAAGILNGDILLIYNTQVIRIPNSWLDAHPGGRLAILHFVGRDATDEIDAFHCENTLKRIKSYAVGTVEVGSEGWAPLVPPLMSGWVRKAGEGGKFEWFHEAGAVRSTENTELSPSSQILLVQNDNELLTTPVAAAPTLDTLAPPPSNLSLKTQTQHSVAYKELHKRITDAGLYQTPYLAGYGREVARFILLGAVSVFAYAHNWLLTSALFLGLLWHQLVFTVHDLGHMGVTHDWTKDRLLAILIADWIGGLSVAWWVENHNVHHLVTNHPSHDPDIEHLPFFAISPVFFSSLWSSYYKRPMIFDRFAHIFIALQHKLFYVVMSLARFNLYALSYGHLAKNAFAPLRAKGGRWAWWLEIAGLMFFWVWYGSVLRGCGSWSKALQYLLVSHIAASPLHVQIVLSHFSMSTADLGPVESFPHRQLRTTTDVRCPPALSFVHGGLHLQVTHHLFPRLPRHNLREASELVKAFAAEQGLVYAEFGFVEGNGEVISVLRNVAEQLRTMGMVAEGEVREAMGRKGGLDSEKVVEKAL